MTTAKTINPFVLPERSTPDNLEDEYDHKEFKQWISNLTVGNVSETARSLHHELNRQNRLDMSPLERFEAVQLMLPTLGFVLEKMREHFVNKPIPLSKENALIVKLHLELLKGVVVAYKAVMSQFHDESFTGHLLHKHTRAESLRRALYFLGEILLHEYTIYRSRPKFVWREIHGIYHYAVINDLRPKVIDADVDGVVDKLNVDDIYKKTLLLALADPGSLLRGEIKKVNEALIDWLPKVSLVSVDNKTVSSSVFVVDSTKDSPPYVTNDSGVEKIKIGWFLFVDKLDQILEDKVNEIKSRSGNKLRPIELVSATLYSKLRKRWSPDAVLREERSKGYGSVDVDSGIDSLHWQFGGWRLQQGSEGSRGTTAGSGVEEEYNQEVLTVERDEFVIDADAELFAAFAAESDEFNEQDKVDSVAQEEAEIDFYNAVVEKGSRGEKFDCVNKSSKGYYLTWSGEGEYAGHVGELIGINAKDGLDEDAWSLGVIRWIRVHSNGLLGFGIELFEGDIESVRLDCHHEESSACETIPGFLHKSKGKVESLITRPFYYGENDKLVMTTINGKVPVEPGRALECTDAFMRFKVHFESNVFEAKKGETKSSSKAEELLNNIWDEL